MKILDRSVSNLAASIVGASTIFRELGVDFCNEGELSLAQVLADKQVDTKVVLAKLNALETADSKVDWSTVSPTRLISHILERYHARHREQLPELVFLATKVERVHQAKPQCPKGLTELLREINYELDNHMLKEEQILFPMLGGGIYPNGPINVMQDEHEEHLQAVEQLRQLTNDITLPAGACNSWKALYLGLQTFVDDLMQHITLENYFLFVPPKATSSNCCGSCQ